MTSEGQQPVWQDWAWAGLMFLAAGALFLWRIDVPHVLVFDETHYVEASHRFFTLEEWKNKSHPPFAKWLIGASIQHLGDNSFAWRLPGALMGAACVASVFALMRLFGFAVLPALFAAILTMLNQTLFVQARTAMLDVYALAFLVMSVVLLIWSAKPNRSQMGAWFGLIVSGVLLGLGASSKWAAGINFALVYLGVFVWRTLEVRGNVLKAAFGAGLSAWPRQSFVGAGMRQGIPALGVYLLTFLPFIFMSNENWTLTELHNRMLGDVAGNLAEHPYSSRWWEWPLMLEPIWYHFARPESGSVGDQAIFLVGNPAIYWAGLVAMLGCLGIGLRTSDGPLLAISGAFLAFWLVWAVIPRELTFFYYYEPAALMLGMGISAFIARLPSQIIRRWVGGIWGLLAGFFFVYFYPVIAAMELKPEQWTNWLWFSFWS